MCQWCGELKATASIKDNKKYAKVCAWCLEKLEKLQSAEKKKRHPVEKG